MKRAGVLLAAALALGTGLRIWSAFSSGVWLDELHTLAHASPPDVAGVLEHTHWDFHAPLFFVAIHFAKPFFKCPEMLRFVPIAFSLLVVIPLLAFARRSRSEPGRPRSPPRSSRSSLSRSSTSELRPYAWLMLASAVACHAAFSDTGRPQVRFVLFAAAVAFGLLTHYLMAFVVLLIGAVRVLFLLPPFRRARFSAAGSPLGLGWLILAGAIGACAFLPWLLDQMSWVLHAPKELAPPDAEERTITEANRTDLLQVPLKTLVPMIRALGMPWTALAIAGTALLVAGLVACGAAWLARTIRRDLPPPARPVAMAIAFALLVIVLVPAMSIWSWARVSVRYLCIAAWLWPLVMCELLAAVRSARLRLSFGILLVGGALLAGIGTAGGKTREDVRRSVALAKGIGEDLARRDPAHPPIYSALLHQPPRFEHCTPYLAYAPGLECTEPKNLPAPGTPGFDRPVVLITRRYPGLDWPTALDRVGPGASEAIVRLRTQRKLTGWSRVDETMSVWVFRPEKP